MTLLAAAKGAADFAQFDVPAWAWLGLIGAITAMLIIDLLLVHRTAHVISIREATIESAIWISIGLAFGVVILIWQGGQAGGEYYAGFLIEKSLSIDNVFVWAVIFSFFGVPREYQFRVLFWGIFGALLLRGIFIFAGVELIERFEWILYLFGAFLIYTAWKIARHDENETVDYEANIAMRDRAATRPDHPRVRRPENVHARQRQASRDAAVRSAGAHRDDRRGLRGGLRAGDPRRQP